MNSEIVYEQILKDINTYITSKIEQKIVWSSENLPKNSKTTLPNSYISLLGTKKINSPDPNQHRSIIDADQVTQLLNQLIQLWFCVCNVTYKSIYRSLWGNQIAQDTQVTSLTTKGTVSFNWTSPGADGLSTSKYPPYINTNAYNLVDGKNKIKNGEEVSHQKLVSLFNDMLACWEKNKANITITYQYCHSSCYSDCHGSGGMR